MLRGVKPRERVFFEASEAPREGGMCVDGTQLGLLEERGKYRRGLVWRD